LGTGDRRIEAAAGKIPACARRSSRGMSKKRWWTSLAKDTEAAAAGWGHRLGREREEAQGDDAWSEGRRGEAAAHMVESTGRRRGGGSDSRLREERTGWRRQEPGGGERAPRGKGVGRVETSRVCGLPNDRAVLARVKIDVGARPGKKKGDPEGLWAPKWVLRGRTHPAVG
jgi:hypothetical protein